MDRTEALHGAVERKKNIDAMEDDLRSEYVQYFRLGAKLFNILFGDVLDRVSVKLSTQIFNNHNNPDHRQCVNALVVLAKCEDFNKQAAIDLVAALRSRDDERSGAEIKSVLKRVGIDTDLADYLVGPLTHLLV